jgi:hypothetical protein
MPTSTKLRAAGRGGKGSGGARGTPLHQAPTLASSAVGAGGSVDEWDAVGHRAARLPAPPHVGTSADRELSDVLASQRDQASAAAADGLELS